VFVVILAVFSLIVIMSLVAYFIGFSTMAMSVLFAMVSMPIIDIVLLVATCWKVLQMSRSSKFSQNSSFNELKERFWMILEFMGVVATVMVMEITGAISFSRYDHTYECLIVLDVIKCYSAALIFTVFFTSKPMEKHRKYLKF
jgi:hypothetical protein